MALGKHLVQAVPSVYALQCLTGKVDNNNNNNICVSLSVCLSVCPPE